MYEFIVLGIIPGTHIQLGFSLWIFVVTALLATYTIRRALSSRFVIGWIVALSLRRTIRQQQVVS